MNPIICAIPFVGIAAVGVYIAYKVLHQEGNIPWEVEIGGPVHQEQGDGGYANHRLLSDLLGDVERSLSSIRSKRPGAARSRTIQDLRDQYHPDRHANLPESLLRVFGDVTAIIYSRTEPLLKEDSAAEQQQEL